MANALIPYKEGKIGFAIQTEQGSAAATPTQVFPLPEAGSGIDPLKNYSFFNWADNNYSISHYMSEGEWNEGTITVPIIPGSTMDSTGAMYLWAFSRTSEATYYQSKWATVWRDLGHVAEKFVDCKVASGTIREAAGNFMSLELSVIGIAEPIEESFPAVAVLTTDPYVFSQSVFSLETGGGALAQDTYVGDMPINFDNKLVSPSDMLTKQESAYPVALPSMQKADITGTMSRLFINDDVYADFKSGQEGAIREVWTSGGTACTVDIPRVVWVEDPIGIPTEDIFKEDSVSWQALGSVDGVTDAISISEVA